MICRALDIELSDRAYTTLWYGNGVSRQVGISHIPETQVRESYNTTSSIAATRWQNAGSREVLAHNVNVVNACPYLVVARYFFGRNGQCDIRIEHEVLMLAIG